MITLIALIWCILGIVYFKQLKLLACKAGLHSWELKGSQRVCKDCGKRQVWIRVGSKGEWK